MSQCIPSLLHKVKGNHQMLLKACTYHVALQNRRCDKSYESRQQYKLFYVSNETSILIWGKHMIFLFMDTTIEVVVLSLLEVLWLAYGIMGSYVNISGHCLFCIYHIAHHILGIMLRYLSYRRHPCHPHMFDWHFISFM